MTDVFNFHTPLKTQVKRREWCSRSWDIHLS